MNAKTPVEYLFVDHERLDAYAEQVSETGVFSRLTKIEVEVSLTPKLTVAAEPQRGTHAKISRLLRHLGELTENSAPFSLHRVQALRVRIPRGRLSQEINFWLVNKSEVQPKVRRRPVRRVSYVLEDRPRGESAVGCSAESSALFSLLQLMKIINSESTKRLPERDGESVRRNRELLSSYEASLLIAHGFDPEPFLEDLNATIYYPRPVTTLCRHRAEVKFEGANADVTQSFYYPVFIAEGQLPLDLWNS